MSIIIRLQNLPWAANSVDIRRYFSGLSIPEGGVHIVGGEKGDAFIAFSTDEDARQAMERDGGKIKDMKVKLLLSSRAEMTRVIEQARNQTLSLQTPAAIKAAASDSDRRKTRRSKSRSRSRSRTRSSSPSRNRKDRDKSPPRDRRKSYSKRDRSRSRSPPRRPDRDRDTDRRNDRSKRDDRSRYDDRGDSRHKNSRDYSSRENSRDSALQDRKHEPDSKARSESDQNKPFDPRVGATPQPFDARHLDGGSLRMESMEFNPRQANLPDGSASYFDPRNHGSQNSNPPSSYNFPTAVNTSKPDLKVDSLQPPFPAFEKFSSLFRSQPQNESNFATNPNFSGNYETKRPSPTPAALAPKVGSNSPYTKGYDMTSRADPYNSISNFGNCPDPTASTYGTVQTAEKGAIPAVPHDRKNVLMGKPIYGAEPHARYEQIPEANQASKSSTAPLPASNPEPYDKRPSATPLLGIPPSSSRAQPRRNRFEQDIPMPSENAYASTPSSELYSSRSTDVNIRPQQNPEIPPFRNNPLLRKDMPWFERERVSGIPDPFRPDLMKSPQRVQEFSQAVPMDTDDNDSTNNPFQPGRTMNYSPFHRENMPSRDNMPQSMRGYFSSNAEQKKDTPFEDASFSKSNSKQPLSNERTENPSRKRNNELPSFGKDENSHKEQSSFAIKVINLPYDVNENDILQLFRGIFISSANLKLKRDDRGEFTAFLKFPKQRDYDEALCRNNQRHIGGNLIEILPCALSEFDNALSQSDPIPKKINSTQPKSQQKSEDEGFYVELQGLPGTCTNGDVKKFFSGLEISDLFLQRNPDGLCSGYVKFTKSSDHQTALRISGKMMGHNYITVTPSNKEKMDLARKKDNSKKETSFPAISSKNQLSISAEKDLKIDPKISDIIFCIAISNVPEFVKNKDLASFFAEDKIISRNIHIMLDSKQMPTGEAFVEFTNIHDFERALLQNGKLLSGSRLTINPITFQEMTNILKNSIPGPPAPPPLLKNPPDRLDKPIKRPPLIPDPPILNEGLLPRDRHQFDNVPLDNFDPRRSRIDSRYPPNEQANQTYGKSRPSDARPAEKLTKPPLYGLDGPSSHLEFDEPAEFPSDGPPSRFGPDGPPRFGPDIASSRYGPEAPSHFGPDGPPHFGADGSRFPPEGPPRFGPDGSRFGPDKPHRFGNERQSRYGPDGPSRYDTTGPSRYSNERSSRFGADGPPPRFDFDGPSSRYGPDGPPPSHYGPDGPPSSRYGSDGPPPSRYGPDGPPSSRYGPDGPPSRRGPDGPPSSRYGPDGPPSRRGPGEFSPHHISDGPPSRRGPDGPHHGSDGPSARYGPDGPSSRRGPDSFSPHHGSDGRYDSDRLHPAYNPDNPSSRFGPDGPPGNFGPDGPPPRFGPEGRPPRFRGPSGPPATKSDGPQDFGVPGCVVAIDNLHFNAGLDELLDAFHGFPIDKDKIIRKYNEKGQPTSEARIAFKCHEDAIQAIEEVNKKPIFGRPIYLSLV